MLSEVQVKINLVDARAQVRLTQIELAKRAEIGSRTLWNAENGVSISRVTAYAILDALNAERAGRNWEALKLSDLDWKIQGD